jgi:hypothetical protein
MYELNMRLSSIFYGPLQGLEILVRNDMNAQLSNMFGENWPFGNTPWLLQTQADELGRTIDNIEKSDPTLGAIVAELPFAFWVGILGPKYENELWRKGLYKAFSNRPRDVQRQVVQGALNSLRRLRNRIAHHEKILQRDLKADHNTILEIAGWCCEDTRDWIASMSTFDPDLLPVAEPELPMEVPEQPMPIQPKPEKPTRDGRQRLTIKSARHGDGKSQSNES